MENIDWFKPVNGYAELHFGIGIRSFKMRNDLQMFFPNPDDPGYVVIRSVPDKPWTGEGLPPVGAVCERRTHADAEDGRYEEVKIIAHTSKGLPVWENTDAMFAGISKAPHMVGGHPEFRPIRTPEQIAADEHEKAIDELAVATDWILDRAACEAVLAAGYRKQVTE